mgnify:CR=1 FL=1
MDELFEALTLIQTKKLHNFPVILIGVEYWTPMMSAILRMKDEGLVSPEDLDLLTLTDSIPEAMEVLKEKAIRQFNLRKVRIPEYQPLLGERKLRGPRTQKAPATVEAAGAWEWTALSRIRRRARR